jgi:hypothetical protein
MARYPMPSPRNTNAAGLYVPWPTMAMDQAPGPVERGAEQNPKTGSPAIPPGSSRENSGDDVAIHGTPGAAVHARLQQHLASKLGPDDLSTAQELIEQLLSATEPEAGDNGASPIRRRCCKSCGRSWPSTCTRKMRRKSMGCCWTRSRAATAASRATARKSPAGKMARPKTSGIGPTNWRKIAVVMASCPVASRWTRRTPRSRCVASRLPRDRGLSPVRVTRRLTGVFPARAKAECCRRPDKFG